MENVGRLSAEQVMRVAEERFIHFSSQNCADDHVFSIAAPSGLSCQETKDVELACLLLASAEKVSKQEFVEATRLLNLCDFLSSRTGSSVQRTVHYFTKALQQRIDRETGRIAALKGGLKSDASHHEEKVYGDPTLISCYLHLPFSQVTQFAGIQAIVESVASVKRVHYIDLAIRNGVQSIVLMQALATRQEFPAEILKITAVGTTTSRQKIEETGKRLACFAETLNLPFSFRTVVVRDIKDLNKGMFEIETKADEVVAVNSPFLLNNMITKPSCLESLIKVLRDLDPCVMVITEVDADHNSPIFLGRFHEALFFYCAFFESLEVCMDQSYANRMALEATYSSEEIVNSVAAEEEDRVFRRMKIDAWRPFFAKFGMVEQELSMSSLYQAELLVKNFASGSSCTLYRNGKCLTVGWKGRPILSLSSWKFHKEKSQKIICSLLSQISYLITPVIYCEC